MSKCADVDPRDHECDVCGLALTRCEDGEIKNHVCEICGDKISNCADDNKDHNCDVCGAVLSKCDTDYRTHYCEYCGKKLTECLDQDSDHECDVCGLAISECDDANKDHKCDICDDKMSDCADDDHNHYCDWCGIQNSQCMDLPPYDHNCDWCGEKVSDCEGGTATCKDKAVCEICGQPYGELGEHNYGEWIVAVPSTCKATGTLGHYACSVCEKNFDIDKNELESLIIDIDPEAHFDGEDENSNCDYCNASLCEEHAWNDGEVITEATCVTAGSEKFTCTACGTTETRTVNALGHDYSAEWTVDAPATCTEAGSKSHHCSRCDSKSDVTEIPATGHIYNKTVVTPATCTEAGYITITCRNCEKSFVSGKDAEADQYLIDYPFFKLDVLGHDMVTDEAVAPTCTETGLTEGSHCSRCDDVTTAQEVVPALGHTDKDDNNICDVEDCKEILCGENDHVENDGKVTTPATCVATGVRTYSCSACGKELRTEEIPVDPNAHNIVKMPAKDKTCTEDGHSVYDACTLCDYEDGKNVIKAPGHFFKIDVVAKAATCTEDGYTATERCMVCDYTKGNETIPALGHRLENWIQLDPTCTEAGYTAHQRCSREGCGYTSPYFDLAPKGHTAGETVVENNTPATCTDDGSYDNVVYCTVCKVELERKTVTVPAGHKLVDVEAKAATCTEDGYTAHKACENCNYVDGKEAISAIGHVLSDAEGKDATCTENGYTAHKACANCDYTEGKDVVSAGHKLVDVEGKDATCTEDGYTAYKDCENCDYTEGKEVVPAGHKDEDENDRCDACKVRMPSEGVNVVFELGANGSASHNDGTDIGASKSYTVDGYTLALTGMSKVYNGARDAKGNSCLKLGTGSVAATLSFNVPDGVSEVIILIAKYKSNTAKVDINGTTYTLTKNSNDGMYDEIVIDTSATKTVTLKTLSGGYRSMINSIAFVSCGHEWETVVTGATCVDDGSIVDTCKNCGATVEETIEATGHTFVDGVCHCGVSEEHVCSYDSVVTAATCTTSGYTTHTCSCGDTYTDSEVEALGHLYDENGWYEHTAATYVNKGEERNDCTRENCDHYDSKDIATLIATTPEEIVNEAYNLKSGEILSDSHKYTLSGTITSIKTAFDPSYNNVTVIIKVDGADEAKTITCFRLTGTGADNIAVGDHITVKGIIKNYNNTIEFDTGCTLEGHTHRWVDATCAFAKHCAICKETDGEVLEHIYVEGVCSVCGAKESTGGETPEEPTRTEITFELGSNKTSASESSSAKSSFSTSQDGYTLKFTSLTNVYDAYDAKGDYCLKLGTGSKNGSFTFIVPDEVTSVIIYVSGRQTKATCVIANNVKTNVNTKSGDAVYTAITIDTTTTKTVTFSSTTGNGDRRAMVDSIVFVIE